LIDRLVNYGISENLSEIREEIAQGHASRCLICNAPEADAWQFTWSTTVWETERDCDDCMSSERELTVVIEARKGTRGHRCSESLWNPCACRRLKPKTRSVEISGGSTETVVETPKKINLQIEEHHVSYEPEITVEVCSTCHGRIHTRRSELSGLQPDMSRREWES